MKNIDIKLATSQTLLIAGLVILSIGGRLTFFSGLALVVIAGAFTLRRDAQPTSRVARLLWTLFYIGCVVFLIWFTSFGAEKPPVAALVGAWLAFSIDEFSWWRKNRRLT
jgi:hypothetical protein